MDDKTLDALKGSIAKWEGILAGTVEDYGTDNCPLCQVFYNHDGEWINRCVGCPVSEKAGERFCQNTPYSDLENLEDSEDDENDGLGWLGHIENEQQRGLVQAELDFLRSLLPADATALPSAQRHSEEP